MLSEKLELPFPLLSDTDMDVISAYGVVDSETEIAIPSLFFIDRDGKILWKHIGETIFKRPAAKKIIQEISEAVKAREENA